eukprot:m.142733 g.142733  ORF g.142733 m.142733 type:complete len:458 (-) comp30266_c0_seq1:39-1412(-)
MDLDAIPAPLRSMNILYLIVGLVTLQFYGYGMLKANNGDSHGNIVPDDTLVHLLPHSDRDPPMSNISLPNIDLTAKALLPVPTTNLMITASRALSSSTTASPIMTADNIIAACISSPTAPRPSVMLGPKFLGRLGNNLFQMISTVAIARSLNTSFCLNWDNTRLKGVTDSPRMVNYNKDGSWACDNRGKLNGKPTLWSVAAEPGFAVYSNPVEDFHSRFTQDSVENRTAICKSPEYGMRWWSGRNADTYFQSWRYFTPELVKELVVFNETLVAQAQTIVAEARSVVGGDTNRVVVSIHIRLGDIGGINRDHLNERGCQYHKQRWVRPAWIPPDVKFYRKAMEWMRDKYPGCMFMVVPQNYSAVLASEVFVDEDTVLINTTEHSEGLDMVLISRGDHAILSMGTYSWWGGYLTGGTVVYYPQQMNTKHWMFSTGFNISDFFPSWWIPLDPEPEKLFCE